MSLMNTETFGPIIPIQKIKTLNEAIDLANNSVYGLGCNIYTNDMEKALTAADDIKAGSFWINDPLTDNEAAPFGGMKMSGGGRELGIEGLDEFRESKHILIDYKIRKKDYWFPYNLEEGRKTQPMRIKIKTDIPGPNSLKLSRDRSKNVANGHGSVCGMYIDKAEGSNLVDVDGNVFIDYAGGIGTMNVGHSHPRVIEAIEKQIKKFIHPCFTTRSLRILC